MSSSRRSFLAGLLATPVAAYASGLDHSKLFDLGSDDLTAVSFPDGSWVTKTAEEVCADIRACLEMLMNQNTIRAPFLLFGSGRRSPASYPCVTWTLL